MIAKGAPDALLVRPFHSVLVYSFTRDDRQYRPSELFQHRGPLGDPFDILQFNPDGDLHQQVHVLAIVATTACEHESGEQDRRRATCAGHR